MAGHIADAQRTDWCTPPEILGLITKFWGKTDLDPCSNESSLVGAKRSVMLPDDGLQVEWKGKVFVNPPYGRGLKLWVKKAAESKAEVLLLIPAATDTSWWHTFIWSKAKAICFIKGRVRFVGADSSAPMANALVYYGAKGEAFTKAFSTLGAVRL